MHCLQFDLGNQILNPEEDKLNKADRPLATGRISLPAARALRWLSVPACLALSACYSAEAVYASIGSALLSGMYNELGGHRNWVTRTALLATNLACFELGACLIAGQKPSLDTGGEHVLREMLIGNRTEPACREQSCGAVYIPEHRGVRHDESGHRLQGH